MDVLNLFGESQLKRGCSPLLLHELVQTPAVQMPDNSALWSGESHLTYYSFWNAVERAAGGLANLGVARHDRVATYLPKSADHIIALFAISACGATLVPINPVLKPHQVHHILLDSAAKVLISSNDRIARLGPMAPDLEWLVTLNGTASQATNGRPIATWASVSEGVRHSLPRSLEGDPAAILYTSGSTGRPKGVILSHRNLVLGAQSVTAYLENTSADRVLSVLPLSFDAGFSQLTTAFSVGAEVVLLDYLLPQDVVRACVKHKITGITAVPPLWFQLVGLNWPTSATESLRYFANTGGKLPRDTLARLRQTFPRAAPYLMYGLTEAFRSTYLPPDQVDSRPDSIGKAIPNAEILIVRPDGSECDADEAGELVHCGPLVAQGYWRDPERTAVRFKPAPVQSPGLPHPQLAVWSGDIVKRDSDGYLYFIGRSDGMIKTSGYRVSPTEIEEVVFELPDVEEAAAFGVTHPTLGESIGLAVISGSGTQDTKELLDHCRARLPAYMVPARVEWRISLPRNPNGKIDRAAMAKEFVKSGGFSDATI